MARKAPASLTWRGTNGTTERFLLQDDVTTLGRSPSCTIIIDLPTVSRLHARIEPQYDRYLIHDNRSANGTFVNGKRIEAEQGYQLSTSDEIWLGGQDAQLCFSDPEQTLAVRLNEVAPALLIDEDARAIAVYRVPLQLSPLEYALLLLLARNAGAVVTRHSCFLNVWGQPYDHATCEDALNACISKLRRHLRIAAEMAAQEPPPIRTIQRVGFRLDSEVVFAPRRSKPAGLSLSAPNPG